MAELKSDQIDQSAVWAGDSMPDPYSPPDVSIQSAPSAAKGGANQRKRNWCSGFITLPAGDSFIKELDGSFGEWVTIQYCQPIAGALDLRITEDNVERGFLKATGLFQFRRNGNKVVAVNGTAGSLFLVVHVTDYESRPVYSGV